MLDQIIKNVFQKKRLDQPELECPEAESLALYIDNRLEKQQKALLEEHLAECDLCLEQVVLCKTMHEEQVSSRAKSTAVDVVVRFLKDTVEVISTLKDIQIMPQPALVPVRGRSMPSSKAATFVREFSDLTVKVEVKSPNGHAGGIKIGAYRDSSPVEKVRVSLFSDDKELASFLTKGGYVNFEYNRMGNYLIRLSKNRISLGEITFEVAEC